MPSEMVPVSLHDLEHLHSILTSVFGSCQVHDLGTSYRRLTNRHEWSPITRAVETQKDIVKSYIDKAYEEDEKDAKS